MDTLIGEDHHCKVLGRYSQGSLQKNEKVLGCGMLINGTLVMRPQLLKVIRGEPPLMLKQGGASAIFSFGILIAIEIEDRPPRYRGRGGRGEIKFNSDTRRTTGNNRTCHMITCIYISESKIRSKADHDFSFC